MNFNILVWYYIHNNLISCLFLALLSSFGLEVSSDHCFYFFYTGFDWQPVASPLWSNCTRGQAILDRLAVQEHPEC